MRKVSTDESTDGVVGNGELLTPVLDQQVNVKIEAPITEFCQYHQKERNSRQAKLYFRYSFGFESLFFWRWWCVNGTP